MILIWTFLALNVGLSLQTNSVYQKLPVGPADDELLPGRIRRSSEITEDDPKHLFFQQLFEHDESKTNEAVKNIIKPGGFKIYYSNRNLQDIESANSLTKASKRHYISIPSQGLRSHFQMNRRKRSNAEDGDFKANMKLAAQIETNIEKRLGQPLELFPLEPDNENVTSSNITEDNPIFEATELPLTPLNSGNDVIVLNDFIRFKRSAADDAEEKEIIEESDVKDEHLESSRAKREHVTEQHTEKLLLQPVDASDNGSREPRETTKEQWIKQVYPVQAIGDSMHNDNYAVSTENIRAPRVHFVTHRLSESVQSPSSIYRTYDREGRSGDLNRDFRDDLSRDVSRDMKRDYTYRAGYNDRPQSYRNRYDPYYHHDEIRDRRYYNPSRYENYDKYYSPERGDRGNHYSYSNRQQRRIIYYATLPEFSRSPPNVDLRDRFAYQDLYDNRHSSPSESYRSRRPSFAFPKARYEQDMEGTKTLYPLKVSTDVNVREIKKNPESRIYSETERRYAFKTPSFQTEDRSYNGHQ